MAVIPKDPVERQKLALVTALHHDLLNYRNVLRGGQSAEITGEIVISSAVYDHFPDMPRDANAGKTLAETIIENWIEPQVKQALTKLDPRNIKTSSQIHDLQGILAYHFTYVREHLSSSQIVAVKLANTQVICDVWCQITGNKRFVVNKVIESLLVVKSARTVQRYVPLGMALVFGISLGSVRLDRKAAPNLPTNGVRNVAKSGVSQAAQSTVNDRGKQEIDPPVGLNLVGLNPASIDADQLDAFITTFNNLRQVIKSVEQYNALVDFLLQIDEEIYTESTLYSRFIVNSYRFEMEDIEQRVDTIEMRERLRNHPVVKQVLDTEHQQQLITTRARDIDAAKNLCERLTTSHSTAERDIHGLLTKLHDVIRNRLDDCSILDLIATTFDQLPEVHQISFITRFFTSCSPQEFALAVSLSARPSGRFVRSRVHFLARSARGCTDIVTIAQNHLLTVENIVDNTYDATELHHRKQFLRDYIDATADL